MALKPEDFIRRLPSYIQPDFSTFVRTDKKMRFIDAEYGEYWMVPYAAFRGQTHPKRGKLRGDQKKTLPFSRLQKQIGNEWKIDKSTYVNTQTKCRFYKDSGEEWFATPGQILYLGYKGPKQYNLLPNGINVTEFTKMNGLKDASTALKIFNAKGPAAAQEYIESFTGQNSSLEIEFVNFLTTNGLNAELFNKSSGIATMNGGFYRPDIKIASGGKILFLDIDGLYWHSADQMIAKGQTISYHKDKASAYSKNNISLMQIREDELKKPRLLLSMIKNKLSITEQKIFARKCILKPVTNPKTFLEMNHLMGNFKSAKHLGLYFQDELVCLVSYKKFKKGIDISRFCTKLNLVVIGGLSKLLKEIERLERPDFIQSFVDLRYGTGSSLANLGFKLQSITLGWKWTDGNQTFNRLQCRANLDERKLTEKEYAKELGWCRIYDAGQALFVKKLNSLD